MDDQAKQNAINRLKSAVGHLQGIVNMLEKDTYCIDVIKQIQAVESALEKTSQLILDSHLHTCVTTAIKGDDSNERERVLSEVVEVFKWR
ncbi:MAG: metal-sensitive transcriptional regulator [Anaerolineae bacterium]|nr:MAG: metal-sensitive transcriptional regulator [Anaerolineae bacterium]MCL4878608.1 metal-sensitive transcriptional regulator [Anaerolineae bacterium]